MSKTTCYVCGYSYGSAIGRDLKFHNIPSRDNKKIYLDSWLQFLHLPPSDAWPNQKWKEITLCSLHFKKDDYSSRKSMFGSVYLKYDAVPSLNCPCGPGKFGELFCRNVYLPNEGNSSCVSENSEYTSSIMETGAIEEDGMNALNRNAAFEEESFSTICHGENSQPTSSIMEIKAEEDGTNICNVSAILDHDYTGKMKYIEEEKGSPKAQENAENRSLLGGVRRELCRLCGQMGSSLRPIFEEHEGEIEEKFPVYAKIEAHLPFKVTLDDPLPLNICVQCFDLLNRWHELYVTCVATNAVLWKTFGEDSKESSKENESNVIYRDHENVKQYAEFCSIAESGEKTSTIDQANQTEELDMHCSACGMDNIALSVKKKSIDEDFGGSPQEFFFNSFSCVFCSELFSSRRQRNEHVVTCRELSAICENCGKHISARKYLTTHRNAYHAPVSARSCEKCGKCFSTPDLRKSHLRVVHQRKEPKYYCKLCCTAFHDNKTYLCHQYMHKKGKIKFMFRYQEILEGSDTALYACPVCQENFRDALSLVVHLNVKKIMKCPVCRKQLRSEKRSLLHVCQFHCRYCFKMFKSKVQCSDHERIHTGEKPFKCSICDKHFRTNVNRKRHESIHDPSFRCSYCRKKLKDEAMFVDHVRGHEGKPSCRLCSICGKQYSGERGMRRHMLKTHPREQLESHTRIELPPESFTGLM